MILHPEGNSVAGLVEVIQNNFTFFLKDSLLWDAACEVKGQQLGNLTSWVGRIFPEWVWLCFYPLDSGSVLTNLQFIINTFNITLKMD